MAYSRISCSEFGRRLMRTRPVSEDIKLETPLKRCLNAPQLILYCVSHMVGAGLYVLTGQLIRDYAGPATAIAYLISAITAIFTGLCYAEFTTLFPRAGSSYLYTYLMFGELPAFIIGWTMISDIIVSTAAISKALSGTINLLTNNTIRVWSQQHLAPLGSSNIADSTPDIVAAAFLVLLIILTVAGANVSLTINAFLSAIQICSLVVIAIACFVLGSPANYTDYGGFFPYGVGGLLRGAGLAVFGFSGFEAIANASEEAKNPRRDLPLALFSSLLICAILYLGASLGLAYLVPRWAIVYDSPFVGGFDYIGQTGMMAFAAFATILATGATKIVDMYVIPRLFYSIASDGLLFNFMACVERHTQVPIWSLLIGGLITILLATFIKIQVLAEFTSVGIIFSYFVIGLDLMVLRYVFQDEHQLIDNNKAGTEEEDWIQEGDLVKDKRTLLPTPTTLWLRSGTPDCFKWLEKRTCFKLILFGYTLCVIIVGISINMNLNRSLQWVWIICGIFTATTFLLFILLCFYEPMKNRRGFQTPIMPVAPCITILTNGILVTSMESLTWARFIIWTIIGLIIYFAYGMWHSKADSVKSDASELNWTGDVDLQKSKP